MVKKWYVFKEHHCDITDETCYVTRYNYGEKAPDCADCEVYKEWKTKKEVE